MTISIEKSIQQEKDTTDTTKTERRQSTYNSYSLRHTAPRHNNSVHVVEKILDRLDKINNATLMENQYEHEIEQVLLQKIYQLVNGSK